MKFALTTAGVSDFVSHFKQPFNAASMTLNCASIFKYGMECLAYVAAGTRQPIKRLLVANDLRWNGGSPS